MNNQQINFIESMAGQSAADESARKKKIMDDAKMKGIDLENVSPAVKEWFLANGKKEGKEI